MNKFNAVIAGLFLLLAAVPVNAIQYGSSDVGTAWGGDVHSSVRFW